MATIVGTSGNDNLSGTAVADSIYGLAGNDHINGLGGNDTIYGNTGTDLYTLPDNDNIDGGSGDDLIYGEAGNDIIDGGTGNDIINGGAGNDIINGGAGIDTMLGSDGNDAYYVDSTSDVVTESVGVGTDTVYAYADYRVSTNVENLYLYGSAYAGYGNALNNYIAGNSSNNYLWGGAGIDTMVGGLGNDAYDVDSTSDVVTEGVGAGTDTVYASADYRVSANVENLYLFGSAYAGYGNALNNYIAGNSSNNYLWGGAGIDTMVGGLGNDAYDVDSTSDVVTEGVGAGTDTVYAYASYTLGANVENLYLFGSANYSGSGNALNNYIAGNSSNNILNGGAGIDTMAGGLGNDIYYVDSASDVVIEGVNASLDSVYSSASYTLSANVEILNLQGSAYFGYGNELNNYIGGSNGNNYLWGGAGNDTITGGAGSDELIGGAGIDYFTFYSREGVDTIRDFSRTQGDKIGLSSSGFGGLITTTGLIPGSLHPSQFVVGAAAADSSDRIIYNSSTGALFFDSDGTGANLQVQFAYLPELNRPILISSDFQVIA